MRVLSRSALIKLAEKYIGIPKDTLYAYVLNAEEDFNLAVPMKNAICFKIDTARSDSVYQVYRCNSSSYPYEWIFADFDVPIRDINFAIGPVGGWNTANAGLYKTMRGNFADITKVPREDGLQFYAKDKDALFIYNATKGEWRPVHAVPEVPVGGIIGWLNDWPNVPDGYERCGNTRTLKADKYPELAKVITPIDGEITLPVADNMIIRVK